MEILWNKWSRGINLVLTHLLVSPLVESLRIIALAVSHLWVVNEFGSWVRSVLVSIGRHVVSLAWALSSLLSSLIVVESIVNIWTEPGLLLLLEVRLVI